MSGGKLLLASILEAAIQGDWATVDRLKELAKNPAELHRVIAHSADQVSHGDDEKKKDSESVDTFSAEPTEEPKPPEPKIALAGEDGQAAIHLVKSAMDAGKAVLESITRDAIERKLNHHTGPLFNEAETKRLADALASTNATAELLGRYRIRERQKTMDQGKRFAALTPGSSPPLVKPIPPDAALKYFRELMPSLAPIPGFDERCHRTAFTLALHTGSVMLKSVQDAITTALAEGKRGTGTVTEILNLAGVSPSNPQYADMVFRTNAVDALNAGFDDERQAPDVIEEFPAWEYLGIEDGREGDDHRPKFGNYYPANVTFAQARGKRPFNCILPGQYVQGRVKTALKSFYSGKAFEIHTAGGSKFSVTANHPVLTDNGFVAAKMLKKSDRTLRYQGESQVGIVNVNEQYPPALIEDVFESMAVVFGSTRETPFSSFDLHGDAEFVEGEIEVVRADRSLQPAIKTGTQQSSMEPVLSRASVAFKGEPSRSPLALHLERIFHATSGFMSGFDLLHSKASIHLTPLESFRIGSASDLDVVFFEPTGQSASIESSLVSQLLERFTSEVSFDEIIEIRDFDYTGHVYDLETETGYLTVGSELYGVSTIISNCRCGSRAINRREWSRLLANGATFANVS